MSNCINVRSGVAIRLSQFNFEAFESWLKWSDQVDENIYHDLFWSHEDSDEVNRVRGFMSVMYWHFSNNMVEVNGDTIILSFGFGVRSGHTFRDLRASLWVLAHFMRTGKFGAWILVDDVDAPETLTMNVFVDLSLDPKDQMEAKYYDRNVFFKMLEETE